MSGRKPIVLFVHGFGSSSKRWNTLRGMAEADPELAEEFEFEVFDYSSAWINLNPLERIPSLRLIASLLGSELETDIYADRDVILVGHSQGGLVIQRYISSKLADGKGRDLANVCQVITFATPNKGATIGMSLRKMLFALFLNPQERTLRVFNEEVDDTTARCVWP